jgi:flagellar motor switch protein FliM
VSEQEIDALLSGAEASVPAVAPRDFKEPRRFAPEGLEALRKSAQAAAEGACAVLRGALAADLALEGVELAEVSLDALLAPAAPDLAALLAEGPAGPSLAALELASAVRLAELALGADEAAPQARPLSPTEARLLERLLARALERAAQPFALALKDPRFAPDRAALARELAATSERSRLAVRAEIALSGSKLVLHLLLAGVKPAPARAPAPKDARKAALPAQIAPTSVEVSAVLAQTELLLSDLLHLEAGDVIPLDAAPGQTVELHVEGAPRARARFGQHGGQLAVRVTELLKPNAPR